MSLSVDLFWSFRSPYSYLALPRTCALVETHELDVHLRPVYPLAVRDGTFFQRTPPQFARYVKLDSRRVAEQAGIPFGMPRPDPIVQDMQTLVVAPEQPRIRCLMQLGAAAQLQGRSLAFAREGLAAVIEQNQRDHEASGHWGVPTFVFEGEPFFGQDRIDLLVWRLGQRGLKRRAAVSV